MKTNKMKVEIWSDVTCPFCYIGKRNFESALSQFKGKDGVEIIWKSYELVPGIKTEAAKNVHQFLAEHKGISLEQSIKISDQVADIARQVGLVYNFHKAIPANSFNAHRSLHLAKKLNLQDKAKESLLEAYFTDGRNIDDIPTLIALGGEIGLDSAEVKKGLESDQYADEVNQDIFEAKQQGLTSVPSFVFDKKLTVSGAHNSKTFLELLEKTFAEWRVENPETNLIVKDEQSCTVDGHCN
jgi:predicted DsbA family dithiol-disulfide isomerase